MLKTKIHKLDIDLKNHRFKNGKHSFRLYPDKNGDVVFKKVIINPGDVGRRTIYVTNVLIDNEIKPFIIPVRIYMHLKDRNNLKHLIDNKTLVNFEYNYVNTSYAGKLLSTENVEIITQSINDNKIYKYSKYTVDDLAKNYANNITDKDGNKIKTKIEDVETI